MLPFLTRIVIKYSDILIDLIFFNVDYAAHNSNLQNCVFISNNYIQNVQSDPYIPFATIPTQ